MVTGIVLATMAGGAVGAMIVVRSPAPHTTASSTASATALSTSAGQAPSSSGQAGASEQAGAQGVARLLAQSISDRSAIVSAYNDVDTCGPGLVADVQTFQRAATSRQNLLARLGTLSDASALPPALLQALNGAWQSSVTADQDYAAWARDESAHGCRASDTTNAHYQATIAPNQTATTDKTAFTGLWNPIAARYGLSTYQPGQL